jgi:hypothetical protein
MSERFHDIAVIVNGEEVRERVDARKTLVDFLREDVALTGRQPRRRPSSHRVDWPDGNQKAGRG